MARDWKGGTASTFKTIGASNHCEHERQAEDYYATEPAATDWLCRLETFSSPILEPSCGEGHISKQLIAHGYDVVSRDIVDRGYGEVRDFLFMNEEHWNGDIITNPPYAFAQEFVEQALKMVSVGHKVAMFLKLTFLEGKKRREFFRKNPPRRIWVSSSRLKCAMNGEFCSIGSSATAYAWYVWEKGFTGNPEILWFN
jgi:hypothetical protein